MYNNTEHNFIMNESTLWCNANTANAMNGPATENDILDAAIGAIRREADLRLDVVGRHAEKDDGCVDAIIRMPNGGV